MRYYKLLESGKVELTQEGETALSVLGITLDELKDYPDEKLDANYWQGCKTYVDQALKNRHGCSWLDKGRIPYEPREVDFTRVQDGRIYGDGTCIGKGKQKETTPLFKQSGRFPANLLVSDDMLNDGKITRSGSEFKVSSGGKNRVVSPSLAQGGGMNVEGKENVGIRAFGDSGSFSRYFDLDKWFEEKIKQLPASVQKTFSFLICPKAGKSEKNKGCEELPDRVGGGMQGTEDKSLKTGSGNERNNVMKNNHPTVKPIKLMSYLVTLGSREGDIVLDPFAGTCTTAISCELLERDYIMIEKDPNYIEIGKNRIKGWTGG